MCVCTLRKRKEEKEREEGERGIEASVSPVCVCVSKFAAGGGGGGDGELPIAQHTPKHTHTQYIAHRSTTCTENHSARQRRRLNYCEKEMVIIMMVK